MLSVLLVLATTWLAAVSFLVLLFRLAPVGIEDAEGFHVVDGPGGGTIPSVVAVRVF